MPFYALRGVQKVKAGELNLGETAGPLSPRSHCYIYIGPDRTPYSEIILMMNNRRLVRSSYAVSRGRASVAAAADTAVASYPSQQCLMLVKSEVVFFFFF